MGTDAGTSNFLAIYPPKTGFVFRYSNGMIHV
jgi:hypothetical protein